MAHKLIKPKPLILSNCLFFIVIIINSFIYLFYDFMNNDVEPNVRIYGKTQLIITLVAVIIILINVKIGNKFSRQLSLYALYFTMGILLFIQIMPAILWFLFNGRVAGEYPFSPGIIGSWLYGAYHILIIAWGIFNIRQYKQTIKKNINPIL